MLVLHAVVVDHLGAAIAGQNAGTVKGGTSLPGAKQEGIVRNERILPDGRKRNSVRFSITDAEWPAVRKSLESRLKLGPEF